MSSPRAQRPSPGVFVPRHRRWTPSGVGLDHAAMEAAAAEVTGQRFADRLQAMRLVDTYTSRLQPLPRFVLRALATALGIARRWRRATEAPRAQALLVDGKTPREVAKELGVPEATVRDWRGYDAAADDVEPLSAEEAKARDWSPARRWRLLVTVQSRSEPLPVWLWLAVGDALGLIDPVRGLRVEAVKALDGAGWRPDWERAAAAVDGAADVAGRTLSPTEVVKRVRAEAAKQIGARVAKRVGAVLADWELDGRPSQPRRSRSAEVAALVHAEIVELVDAELAGQVRDEVEARLDGRARSPAEVAARVRAELAARLVGHELSAYETTETACAVVAELAGSELAERIRGRVAKVVDGRPAEVAERIANVVAKALDGRVLPAFEVAELVAAVVTELAGAVVAEREVRFEGKDVVRWRKGRVYKSTRAAGPVFAWFNHPSNKSTDRGDQ